VLALCIANVLQERFPTVTKLVSPHSAAELAPLLLPKGDRNAARAATQTLPKVMMTSREMSDLLLMSMGAYTPLKGFMDQADWFSVCTDMKLKDGTFWPIPITLSISSEQAANINIGDEVALVEDDTQTVMGRLQVLECYQPDKEFESDKVFGTTEEAHPGVAKVIAQKEFNLAGSVEVFDEGWFPKEFGDQYIRPNESRELFAELGWSKIAAFQTRNPMHRSHEHLVKIAVEVTDGVFIHQSLGKLKPGDIPASVRTEAINVMVENYFPDGRVIQAGYPIEMRYAGPREALLHALIRQNFGCSHLIVGRDHAGVGDYYGLFDSQNIFEELWDSALITQALKIDITFYCYKCDGMATAKTCPHEESERVHISGTRQREMLSNNEDISPKFSRPEVVSILRKYYENKEVS
jgi:sulfate adenylyltransferase